MVIILDLPPTTGEIYKNNDPSAITPGSSLWTRKSDSESLSLQQEEPCRDCHGTLHCEQQYGTSDGDHRPVQIIRPDLNGTYSVDQNQLETVFGQESVADLPVAVYSVAGAFLKGKSFMLNFFIRFLTAATQEKVGSQSYNFG